MYPFSKSLHKTMGAAALCLGAALGQDYGGPGGDVPASIVDVGTKNLAVLVKHPVTGALLGQCDGVATDADGNIFISEPAAGNIYKVSAQGQASVFYSGHNDAPNGLDIDPQGRLTACVKGAILRFTKDGVADTLAASGNGVDFKSLKNISIGSNGAMYVTNGTGSMIFFVSADGKTVKSIPGAVSPNGIQWIEEKKTVYVSDNNVNTVMQYDVNDDGTLANKRFLTGKPNIPGADGLAFDEKAEIYVAGYSQGAVHVYSPGNVGPFLGHIYVKGSTIPVGNNTNQIFGGADHKTLLMTGNGGCFKLQLKVAGRVRPGAGTGLLLGAQARMGLCVGAGAFTRRAGAANVLTVFFSGDFSDVSGRNVQATRRAQDLLRQ